MFPEILATPEAAKYLGVSASFLSKLRCTGGGPSYVKLGRRVLYPKARLGRELPSHIHEWRCADEWQKAGRCDHSTHGEELPPERAIQRLADESKSCTDRMTSARHRPSY